MKNRLTGILSLAISILLAGGIMTVFRACAQKEDGTWMHCHYAQMNVFYIAVVMVVISLINLFVSNRKFGAGLWAVSIILSIIVILIPGTIMGMCMMDTMRCWAVMKPFVMIVCVLMIIVSLVGNVMDMRAGKE